MEHDYLQIGKKAIINGETMYAPDYYDDGCTFGTFFKDEKAYNENADEICYIPEAYFDDAESVEFEGKIYYKVDGFTRRNLEELVAGYYDVFGEPLEAVNVFNALLWQCPETYLNEVGDYLPNLTTG